MRGSLGLGIDINLIGGRGGLDPVTQTFVERVLADGGTVEDIGFLNAFIANAKANNYFSDIVSAYSPSWGVKGGATASDLYSITGVGSDFAQGTAADQPTLVPADINGKTSLSFDGINDNMATPTFPVVQPQTIILMGTKQVSWTASDVLIGSAFTTTIALQQKGGGVSPEIVTNVAGATSADNSDLAVGTYSHVRMLNDISSTKIQVDNNAETTGTNAVGSLNGLYVGGFRSGSLFANFNVSAIVLLDSVMDANYAAKMAAIYNFSKSAYGTA